MCLHLATSSPQNPACSSVTTPFNVSWTFLIHRYRTVSNEDGPQEAISVILSDFSHLWAGELSQNMVVYCWSGPKEIEIRVRKFHNQAHNISIERKW